MALVYTLHYTGIRSLTDVGLCHSMQVTAADPVKRTADVIASVPVQLLGDDCYVTSVSKQLLFNYLPDIACSFKSRHLTNIVFIKSKLCPEESNTSTQAKCQRNKFRNKELILYTLLNVITDAVSSVLIVHHQRLDILLVHTNPDFLGNSA